MNGTSEQQKSPSRIKLITFLQGYIFLKDYESLKYF